MAEITKIHVPRSLCSDRWAWHHTNHGDFIVRSAYLIELHSNKRNVALMSNSHPSGKWKFLWKAQLPTKVKNFGWRALHGGMPGRENLRTRGVVEDSTCPWCGEAREDITHALYLCHDVQPA